MKHPNHSPFHFPAIVFILTASLAFQTGLAQQYNPTGLIIKSQIAFHDAPAYEEAKLFCKTHRLNDAESARYMQRKEMEFSSGLNGSLPGRTLLNPGTDSVQTALTSPCNNLDFETGTFTGWTGAIGYNTNSAAPLTIGASGFSTLGVNSSETSCSYHTLVNAASGNDPYGIFPQLDVGGGIWALRMGGQNINTRGSCTSTDPNTTDAYSNGETIQQTFLVTASNALFNFNYAIVMASSPHNQGENPYVRMEVLDQTGAPVQCLKYNYEEQTGGTIIPGFLNCSGAGVFGLPGYYSPWSNGSFNLTPYIGTTVTIRFTSAGCTYGGHFSTLYLDCYCSPVQILSSSLHVCSGGTVSLTAPGSGIGGTYQWQTVPLGNPGITGSSTNQNAVINAAGSYRVIVTPGPGCTPYSIDITITAGTGTSPTAVITHVNSTPCPLNSGTAQAAISGGSAPYQYTWVPLPGGGQGTSSITGLAPQSYTLSFSDANGCANSASVQIAVSGGMTDVITTTSASCGVSNGSANVAVSGGVVPYRYTWNTSPTQTTATATGLASGVYLVTIRDTAGCYKTDTAIVTNPGAPLLTISTVSPLCNGLCSGKAVASASGGAGHYLYSWSSNSTFTSYVNGLCAGTYTCKVKDSLHCVTALPFTISQPPPMVAFVTTNGNTCFNQTNGSATISIASGGTAPYSYSWSPVSSNTASCSNLASGQYTCMVTDSGGCTETTYVQISSPPAIAASVSAASQAICHLSNGSATVTASGGTGPLTYSWSPSGATTATATNLAAGSYTVTVTDSTGCSTSIPFGLSNSNAAYATSQAYPPLCLGVCNGSAWIRTPFGGGPFTYSWSPVAGTSDTLKNLCPGQYTCQVTDSGGCVVFLNVYVQNYYDTLKVAAADTGASCNHCDGRSYITAVTSSYYPPYTYSWSNGGTAKKITNLCAGTYTCAVTDSRGCQVKHVANIFQDSHLGVTMNPLQPMCTGYCNGIIFADPVGGTGVYTYSWSPHSSGTGNEIWGLCPGAYTVLITDGSSCQGSGAVVLDSTSTFSIYTNTNRVSCYGLSDGQASVQASNGYTPYTYSWSPGSCSASTYTGLLPGTYTCYTRDHYGCISNQSAIITQPAPLALSFSNTHASCLTCADGKAKAIPTGGNTLYTYSWTPSGCTHDTCSHLLPGIYTCCVTDYRGCNICVSDTISGIALGIENYSLGSALSVFPNPFTDHVYISLSQHFSDGIISIQTILGQNLISVKAISEQTDISTSELSSGVYLITFRCGEGSVTRKLVKQ